MVRYYVYNYDRPVRLVIAVSVLSTLSCKSDIFCFVTDVSSEMMDTTVVVNIENI